MQSLVIVFADHPIAPILAGVSFVLVLWACYLFYALYTRRGAMTPPADDVPEADQPDMDFDRVHCDHVPPAPPAAPAVPTGMEIAQFLCSVAAIVFTFLSIVRFATRWHTLAHYFTVVSLILTFFLFLFVVVDHVLVELGV
ncbi:hypothetical protein C2S52_009916 [Perilla frutescens var. hirtella]|nr:hypothetical protein C2S52_009916 [Perilla frutescens var. hirtella]